MQATMISLSANCCPKRDPHALYLYLKRVSMTTGQILHISFKSVWYFSIKLTWFTKKTKNILWQKKKQLLEFKIFVLDLLKY